MKKHIFVFLLTILTAWIPCGFVYGGGEPVKQQTSRTETSGGTKTTTKTEHISGVNSGGGVNTAPCKGRELGDECDTNKGKGVCRKSGNDKVCVMKTCNAGNGYYREHYTLITDKRGNEKCSSGNPIKAVAENGDEISICGSKGICRTLDQAKEANKCKVNANLVKLDTGEKVIAGCIESDKTSESCGDLQIRNKKGTCENCKQCAPGEGCDCTASVKDNTCVYTTTPKNGYKIKTGKGTASPKCEKEGGLTQVSSGYYGKVINKETEEPLPYANIVSKIDANRGCITNDEGLFGVSVGCSLPDGSVMVSYVGYRNSDFNLKKDTENVIALESDDELPEVVIEGCSDTKKTWDKEQSKCVCNASEGFYPDGDNPDVCIKHECSDGIDGVWPVCCDGAKSKYDAEGKQCVCPDVAPEFKNGQCVVPSQCPDDATGTPPKCKCDDSTKRYDQKKNECVDNKLPGLKDDYNNAHDNEQSLANRTLTAATTAATGIGGMQLAQGLAEQRADKNAEQDMAAYIETFRCEYGSGKSVKGGMDEIELPGGNDATMMSLRHEYFALAQSLKDRKESLGMKPGIESEVVLDKADMGLYDDENVGITGGRYSSVYRAMALNSEQDQTKIDADKEKSEKRFKYGATAAAVGVAGGIIGNSLINGKLGEGIDKLGEKIKERKKDKELQKKLNVLEESTKNINIEAGENFDAALNQVIQGVLSKK